VSISKPLERLVVFTRYPKAGEAKTRLIPAVGPQGAADLSKQMTEHVLHRIRSVAACRAVDIEVHYEGGNRSLMEKWLGTDMRYRSQGSGDLGARMERTFSGAFHQGIERVVVIGSDCPGINARTVRTAFDLLDQFDLVLGPAHDGGYYLIGLSRKAPELFQSISWGTSEVRAKTIDTANLLKLRWINIEPLHDVDRAEDLEVWRREVSRVGDSPLPRISVIIPTLNEAEHLEKTLASIENDGSLEILVVDGGSRDETINLAKTFKVRLFTTAAHRARQANAGALAARGDILLFVHGDTRLPPEYHSHVQNSLANPGVVAGAFVLSIDGAEIGLKMIEMLANFRSRVFHLPYGDQALFLRADLFRSLGGFPDMPIMEDFVFIQRLKKKGKISIVPIAVKTSPRRWLKLGILKTTLINQAVLLAYFLGSKPERLVRWYGRNKFRD